MSRHKNSFNDQPKIPKAQLLTANQQIGLLYLFQTSTIDLDGSGCDRALPHIYNRHVKKYGNKKQDKNASYFKNSCEALKLYLEAIECLLDKCVNPDEIIREGIKSIELYNKKVEYYDRDKNKNIATSRFLISCEFEDIIGFSQKDEMIEKNNFLHIVTNEFGETITMYPTKKYINDNEYTRYRFEKKIEQEDIENYFVNNYIGKNDISECIGFREMIEIQNGDTAYTNKKYKFHEVTRKEAYSLNQFLNDNIKFLQDSSPSEGFIDFSYGY